MLDQQNIPDMNEVIEPRGNPLEHGVLLDVHTSSDSLAVNVFIDTILRDHFSSPLTKAKKRNLKVALLVLYVSWWDDPTLFTMISFNKNSYKAGSRYNALRISPMLIEVVKELDVLGLIELHLGFNDRRINGKGRLTRICPTEKLISYFRKVNFSIF